MKIFSGSSNIPLAEKIARNLGLELSAIEIHVFPDGERRIKLNERVLGEDVIVIQPTATPVDQNYIELFFIIDALKRSGAKSIGVVVPYLGYQRQDHVFRDGEAVSLQVMIGILESMNVAKILVLDLHTIKIPEFFHIPIVHLSALPLFAKAIEELMAQGPVALPFAISTSSHSLRALDGSPSPRATLHQDYILVSPDMGGLRRIQKMSELLSDTPWIATVKDRDLDTGAISIKKIESSDVNFNPDSLRGKCALIVDDMVSSGGTLVKAAELLKSHGISKIYAFITHPIFSVDAHTLLQNSEIEKVFVTDSVLVPDEKKFGKLQVISISKMIAEEIKNA